MPSGDETAIYVNCINIFSPWKTLQQGDMHCHVQFIQLCRYMYGFTTCSGISVPRLAYVPRWQQLYGESESESGTCCCPLGLQPLIIPSLYLHFILSLPPPLCFNLQLNRTRYVPTQRYTDWSLWKMEELSKYCISGNLSRNELTLAPSNLPAHHSSLFEVPSAKKGTCSSGILVNRIVLWTQLSNLPWKSSQLMYVHSLTAVV